jgi:hypothetical protein
MTSNARLAKLIDRRVSPAELREALDTPLTDAEREDILALSRWFCKRYPTPLERLAYIRRAYTRWQRSAGLARTAEGERCDPEGRESE